MNPTLAVAEPSRQDLLAVFDQHLDRLELSARLEQARRATLPLLLDWLQAAPGKTWHARWEASGAESADRWTDLVPAVPKSRRQSLPAALHLLLALRLIRPNYRWMLRQPVAHSIRSVLRVTDTADFDRLAQAATDGDVPGRMVDLAVAILARVLVHTGKRLDELTTEDLLAYADTARDAVKGAVNGLQTAHQLLRSLGVVTDPPITSGYSRRTHAYTVEEMVDRHRVASQPIRDLLVRYLAERATCLDHGSLRQVEMRLVGNFWTDLERHHPGIDSIHLPDDIARAWRERMRTLPDGRPRGDIHSVFMIVRAFYLDLAHWAAEDPDTWGQWVAPAPISAADLRSFSKTRHRNRARMHARTRTLAPVLPKLIASARRRLDQANDLIHAAEACPVDGEFVHADRRYRRLPDTNRNPDNGGVTVLRVQPLDTPAARPIYCRTNEDDAFWAWAIIEVLRLTGCRIEELLELSHLSIRHHRMRDGQLVVLLQIAPSKTDRERVLPVCPELAHALAKIVARARGSADRIPVVPRYDSLEHQFTAALPYLFQRHRSGNRVPLSRNGARGLLIRAAEHAGLSDVDGQPLRFTAHDFRRMFATETVNGGLPIHIAAKVLGHLTVATTQGYVAIYPEQIIREVQAHIARRRTLRSDEEYREPTDVEWAEFEQHFRHRKLALGDCYRPYGTDCPHEHACVRCPMMRMDPHQLPRLVTIEHDTHRLIAEATANGWAGEIAGLEVTLQRIQDKKAQVERIQATTNTPVWLALEPPATASAPTAP